MYANDLAYYTGSTEASYERNSELNALQLVWRMELQDQVKAIDFSSMSIMHHQLYAVGLHNCTSVQLNGFLFLIVPIQKLVPTWPLVITLRDLLLQNSDPMEVGIQYSWKYWKAIQEAEGAP